MMPRYASANRSPAQHPPHRHVRITSRCPRVRFVVLRPDATSAGACLSLCSPAYHPQVRATSELCDIEGAAEVLPMPGIPPSVIYRADGSRVWMYVLYAARPPPEGPLEDQDMSDDEDLYDW